MANVTYGCVSVSFGRQGRRLQCLVGFFALIVPNILRSFNTHSWLLLQVKMNHIIELACGRLQHNTFEIRYAQTKESTQQAHNRHTSHKTLIFG